MKRKYGYLALIIAMVVATGVVVYQSSAPEAAARVHDGIELVQLDLIVDASAGAIGKNSDGAGPVETTLSVISDALSASGFQVDSFFDVYYVSNIGSSGQDGVSYKAGANFDVFFEIDISISGKSTIPTEMVALSLTSTAPDPNNPQGAIDAIKSALEASHSRVYYGHVTVLK